MKKTLKNHEVYTLPHDAKVLDLTVEKEAEVWIQDALESEKKVERKLSIHLEPGARVKWMSYQSTKDEKEFTLDEGAQLDYFHHLLGDSEDRTKVILAGNESRVLSQTIFFGHGTERQNVRVDHVHRGKNTLSKMISRGAVKDSAVSHFYGNIEMAPGCSGADGTLEEHNLLLSSGSKIEAVPALEIRHDEVQASHSATLERIDAEKLFYLESRGMDEQTALELLVEGFFWDALQKTPNLAFSEHIFKDILRCLSK